MNLELAKKHFSYVSIQYQLSTDHLILTLYIFNDGLAIVKNIDVSHNKSLTNEIRYHNIVKKEDLSQDLLDFIYSLS